MTLSKTLCLKLLGRPKFDKPLYKKIDYASRSKLSLCVTTQDTNIAVSQSHTSSTLGYTTSKQC